MASQNGLSKDRIKKYRRYLKREERLYRPAAELEKRESGVRNENAIYVLGPMLDAFVVWVLKNAIESGKKRLYFHARDGYFMDSAARKYAERFAIHIE